MKTIIETINGKLVTVIRKPFDVEWVKEQLSLGVPVVVELLSEAKAPAPFVRPAFNSEWWVLFAKHTNREPIHWYMGHNQGKGVSDSILEERIQSVITILPALPRDLRPEHAEEVLHILHLYASYGFYARLSDRLEQYTFIGRDIHKRILAANYATQVAIPQGTKVTFIGAVDAQGNKVEVAIEGMHDRLS